MWNQKTQNTISQVHFLLVKLSELDGKYEDQTEAGKQSENFPKNWHKKIGVDRVDLHLNPKQSFRQVFEEFVKISNQFYEYKHVRKVRHWKTGQNHIVVHQILREINFSESKNVKNIILKISKSPLSILPWWIFVAKIPWN